MLAMYESEFSPRLHFGGVEHPLCVGLKSPVLFLLESGFRHVLARRQADAGQVRITQEHSADTLAEVVDRGLVVDILRNSVFSFGSVNEDIPGDNVEVDIAVLRVTHYFPPKLDFLLDGHLLQNFNVAHNFRAVESPGRQVVILLPLNRRAFHIIQRHIGIVGDLYKRRKRMETPQRNIIVTVSSQVIDVVLPKVKAPHLGYIVLRGVTDISITRSADVQRNVELCAAHSHVWILVDVLDTVQAIYTDDLGQLQPPVHDTPGVGADDPVSSSPCFGTPADAVALAF